MRRTIGDKTVSEQRLEEVLSGMVAATAVPGAAYDWQQDDSEEGGYRVKFAERPTDQVLARISAQYSVSSGEPSRFGTRLSTVIVPQDAYKTRILGTANIGYDPSIQGEFYKPFGGTQYFVAPQFFGGRTHFNSYYGSDSPERHARPRFWCHVRRHRVPGGSLSFGWARKPDTTPTAVLSLSTGSGPAAVASCNRNCAGA